MDYFAQHVWQDHLMHCQGGSTAGQGRRGCVQLHAEGADLPARQVHAAQVVWRDLFLQLGGLKTVRGPPGWTPMACGSTSALQTRATKQTLARC